LMRVEGATLRDSSTTRAIRTALPKNGKFH
jgi:hypothetical protein